MSAPREIDLLVHGGTILTMDDADTVIEEGAVAIDGGRIVAVDTLVRAEAAFAPKRVLDARGHAILPGLVDTYGHAGHGLVRGLFHADAGWPAGALYFEATTRDWWAAEAALAAAERTRFGVTTGQTIIGSTPARMDDPAFAASNAEAYLAAGLRVSIGVGPPDPIFPHLTAPFQVRREEEGVWRRIPYTAEEAIANSIAVIEAWHGAGGGRVRVQLAPPYLFGRHVAHGRLMGHPLPTPADAPRMLAHAREMRALADRYGVALHTHFFRGSVAFARRHFGDDEAQRLFGRDTVVAHANGLAPDEVEWLGARRAAIATVAHTHENLWYGTSPIVALLEAGANVTIATDGAAPYSGYDLLREPSRATWHQWTEHRSQHVLPPGKALRMITIDAAHALGVGDEVGSLEPGKAADLITIDLQQAHLTPTTALPHLLVQYATGRDVTNVIASGELLLANGVHQKIDLDEVLARARHEAGLAYGRFDVRPYRALGRDVWRGARYGGK